MAKSVKSSLKKTIQRRSLSRAELETILFEIEACINSRPLTSTDDEAVLEGDILTPNHFLIGRSCFILPGESPTTLSSGKSDLTERYLQKGTFLDHYWRIWSREYTRNLPQVISSPRGQGLKEGTLVLIREDNTSRLLWPIGVVKRIVLGREGLPRTYEVSTSKGTFIQPVQRLHSLELESPALQTEIESTVEMRNDSGGKVSKQIRSKNTHVIQGDSQNTGLNVRQRAFQKHSTTGNGSDKTSSVVTQYGRQTKPVKILDL